MHAGATLPEGFFTADEDGLRGGIEYGFTSTTPDREVAMGYAKGKASTVFEARMGMIDRGADISWLSQFEKEKEVLHRSLAATPSPLRRSIVSPLRQPLRATAHMHILTHRFRCSSRRCWRSR